MNFVTKRKIDELGRIVLPIEYRRFFNLKEEDFVDIKVTEHDIIVSKAQEGSDTKKTVDALGRIVIPHELRERFNFEPKTLVAILPFEDGIHLAPTEQTIETLETVQSKTSSNEEVFEKDYTENRRRYHALTKDLKVDNDLFNRIKEAGVFADYHRRNMQIPRIINPQGKEAYENALEFCNKFMLVKGGKIRGVVNYEEYIAYIDLTCKFFEFVREDMSLLQYIAHTAEYVLFDVNTFGEIAVHLRYPYFNKIDNGETPLYDALHAHPELVAELLAHRQEELKAMLRDPELAPKIAKGAAEAGVTPEEYLDRLEDAVEENPAIFINLITEMDEDAE